MTHDTSVKPTVRPVRMSEKLLASNEMIAKPVLTTSPYAFERFRPGKIENRSLSPPSKWVHVDTSEKGASDTAENGTHAKIPEILNKIPGRQIKQVTFWFLY